MNRFVRMIATDPKDPGARLRIEYDWGRDIFGAFDEQVPPEQINNPDCHPVESIGVVELDYRTAVFLRDAMVELIFFLDEERK